MNINLKMIESRSIVALDTGERSSSRTEGPLGVMDIVSYLDWGNGFMGMYICQNVSNYAFQIFTFYCMFPNKAVKSKFQMCQVS